MMVGMAPREIHSSMDGKEKDDGEELVSKKNQSRELQGGRANNASVQSGRGERKMRENKPFHL